jgi:hypothetical protein
VSLPASARFPVTAAVSFALFSQAIFIETSRPQFGAHVSSDWPLACFTIGAAIAFPPLAQPIFVFTSKAQLLTLPATSSGSTIVDSNAARSNF